MSHPGVEPGRSGVGVCTFRRWRDEAARVPELFDTRCRDCNVRHFHEKLVVCHDVRRSYVWLILQAHGRTRAAPQRRGAAARTGASGRAGRCPGCRLALDVRSAVDVTDAASEIRSAFLSPKRAPASGRFTRRSAGCSVRSALEVTTSTLPKPAARSTRTTQPSASS